MRVLRCHVALHITQALRPLLPTLSSLSRDDTHFICLISLLRLAGTDAVSSWASESQRPADARRGAIVNDMMTGSSLGFVNHPVMAHYHAGAPFYTLCFCHSPAWSVFISSL